jgi:hypothetical protein
MRLLDPGSSMGRGKSAIDRTPVGEGERKRKRRFEGEKGKRRVPLDNEHISQRIEQIIIIGPRAASRIRFDPG